MGHVAALAALRIEREAHAARLAATRAERDRLRESAGLRWVNSLLRDAKK